MSQFPLSANETLHLYDAVDFLLSNGDKLSIPPDMRAKLQSYRFKTMFHLSILTSPSPPKKESGFTLDEKFVRCWSYHQILSKLIEILLGKFPEKKDDLVRALRGGRGRYFLKTAAELLNLEAGGVSLNYKRLSCGLYLTRAISCQDVERLVGRVAYCFRLELDKDIKIVWPY